MIRAWVPFSVSGFGKPGFELLRWNEFSQNLFVITFSEIRVISVHLSRLRRDQR